MTCRIRFILLIIILSLNFSLNVSSIRADCIGYTVQRGDTLYRIARINGTTWQKLAEINKLVNADRIYTGQCLLLNIDQSIISSSIKGLAMADWRYYEDLQTLNISWYYGWGEYCNNLDNRCINMVRNNGMPKQCYDILLYLNEPNAIEPYGFPVTPIEAVNKVIIIETQCPKMKLVVGNVSVDDWDRADGCCSGENWLRTFLRDYQNITGMQYTGAIGVHCYALESADYCLERLRKIRNVYAGEMWVTEMGILNGDLNQFKRLYEYTSIVFTRVAVYTNRQPGSCYGEKQEWELTNKVDLIDCNGKLTPIGQWYAER